MDQLFLQHPGIMMMIMFVLILAKELVVYLYNKKSPNKDNPEMRVLIKSTGKILECLSSMEIIIEELHKWHAITDEDGVKIWYVRRSLEAAVLDLSQNIAKQTVVLEKMMMTLQAVDRDVQDMKKAT